MLGWCIVYIACMLLLGGGIGSILLRRSRRSIVEYVALAVVLGAGSIGLSLLWLSMLGVKPNRLGILVLGAIGAAGVVAAYVTRASSPCERLGHGRDARVTYMLLCLLPILGLIGANLLSAIPAIGMPLFEWDSFAIWGLKAKVLYYSALSPKPEYFTDVRFSFSHLDYPLMLPMLTAGGFAALGEVNDQLGKIALPLLFAGQTLMAYVGARLWLNPLPSLMAALLLIGAPFNVQFAGLGTADMTLTTFRLASIVYLARWIQSRERADIALCAFFTLFAAMSKSEGLPLALLNGLVIAIVATGRRGWKDFSIFAVITGIGIAIWLIWKIGIPQTDEGYFTRLTAANIAAGMSRLGTIGRALLRGFTDIPSWGGLWILLALLAILGLKAFRQSQAIALWGLFIGHLGLYVLIYMITPWELSDLLPVTLPRLMMHLAPTAMLLIALHGKALLPVAQTPAEPV